MSSIPEDPEWHVRKQRIDPELDPLGWQNGATMKRPRRSTNASAASARRPRRPIRARAAARRKPAAPSRPKPPRAATD